MENKPRLFKLSKHFNENVQLVAGVCPKCYSECSEVKITAVNRKFLKITNQHHLLENILPMFTKDKGKLKTNSTSFNEDTIQEEIEIENSNNKRSCFRDVDNDKLNSLDPFEKNNKGSYFVGDLGKETEIQNVNLNEDNCEDNKMVLQYNNNNNSNLKDSPKIKTDYVIKQNIFFDELSSNPDPHCSDKKITGISKYFLRSRENKLCAIKNREQGVEVKENVIHFNNISTSGSKTESIDTIDKRSTCFLRKQKKLQTKLLKRKANVCNEIITSPKTTSIIAENKLKLPVYDEEIPLSQTVSRSLTDEEIIDPSICSYCQEKLLQGSSQFSTTSSEGYEENYTIYEPKEMSWVAPKSPHNLIEESLSHDPWALLVATIFLNKTSCMVARKYVEEFLQDNPTPRVVLKKDSSELVKYFINLGLHQRRAEQVWKMTHDFLHKKWKNAGELYGIGQYGEDAYRMFCLGDMGFRPRDRFLRIYRAWYKMNFSQRDGSFFKVHHSGDDSYSSENSD